MKSLKSLQRKPCLPSTLLSLFALMLLMATQASANVNVLIIGSSGDSNFAGKDSSPFPASDIRTQLNSILSGAGLGTVKVTLIDRYSNNEGNRYSLVDWFHYPYPADVETTTRWPNLRGENGTVWDYVILIGDPYTMEKMPGLYAQGVATIAQEVAKGSGETVLLMPWPGANSSSSVNHYKEVVYRAGRTGGYKVAPAALAWEADNKPTDATRRAFICASSIYSTIWGQSASASTYVYNDTLADAVHNTTTTHNSKADALLFTGSKFNFQSPFLMLGDPRRDIHFGDKGTSTEGTIAGYSEAVLSGNRLSYVGSCKEKSPDPTPDEIYKGTYNSNTPEDDGLGWPTERNMPIAWNHGRYGHPDRDYVTNPAYWQIGFGYSYQNNTFSDTVANANDDHISKIFSNDLNLANHMMGGNMQDGQDPSARIMPWRLLWAQIHKEYPTLNPLADGSGPHLNGLAVYSVANYMYTIYSGRCPLGPKPSSMSEDWWSAKVGYETAWRVGTGSSRAPGFKVMPSSASALSVSSTNTETMSVQFIFPPTSNVTVNVSSSNSAVGSVSPSQLVFTPANYDVPQTITVASAAGLAASAYFDVVFTTSSTDSAYNNLGDRWKYAALKTGETQTITVTPLDADCAEANNSGTFLLTRSGVNPNPLTVNYTLSGTAVNGTDYSAFNAMYNTALNGAITFDAHSNTAVIKIAPIDDADYEGPKTVTLNLTSSANYQVGSPGSNTLTIADNEKPIVSIASNLTSAQEGGTSPVLTFSRTGNAAVGPLTVYYATSGSATMGADYASLSGAVTIPQYQSSISITVPILKDGIGEIAETLGVSISGNAAYTTASSPDNSCAITINDHSSDPVLVAISAADATASEPLKGDGAGTFVISRSRDSGMALTVGALTSNSATPGVDYLALPETVTIPAGATSTTVTLTPIDDNQAELDEIVTLSLQAGSGFMLGFATSANINLYDDESPQVRVETSDTKCIEQTTPDTGSFVLRRLGNRTNALSVNVTTSGTATSGSDYAALASSYTIGANSGNSSTITLTPIDDLLVEGTEKVTFTVGAGTGYTVNAQNSATLEIREDETVDVKLSVSDSGCAEQSSPDTGVFRITRVATPSPLTVSYTLSGTATNGVDYLTLSGTATIPENTATVDIVVTPIQDALLEGPETVTMTLVDGGLVYELEDARESTLLIKDDELPSITLTVTDGNAGEADGGTTDQGLWTFTSSFAPASDLTIKYNVSSNNGIDCESLPGTIVIPAGQTSVTLPLIPIDDELAEGAENVGISLAASSGYNINTTSGLNVKIAASDIPELTIIAADPIALESPLTKGHFAISSSKVFGGNTLVKYTVSGTATSGTDYTSIGTSVTINGGNSSFLLNVNPLTDASAEGAETVTATLILNGTLYTIGDPSSATVSICDDELSIPNTAPVAINQSVNVAYETPAAVTLAATDADNNPLTYSMVSGPTKGSLSGTPPNLTYTPNNGVSGSDSFTFKANDGSVDSNTATVSIAINLPVKYASWSGQTFANPFTDIAPTSNPDGDSMGNLMEFAFGADPTVHDGGLLAIDGSSHGSPTLKKSGGNFELYFVRRKDHGASGSVSYTPQFSSNLSSFTNSLNTPTWVANSASDPTHYEVVKVPFPNGTKFGRVQIVTVP